MDPKLFDELVQLILILIARKINAILHCKNEIDKLNVK